MVGCVIVRHGQVVGRGYHRRFGGPHAEVFALREAGARARGATVYVTLEPCCHHGRTPPCTEALAAAGVRRVIAAMKDPVPKVRGRGAKHLISNNIEVSVGLLEPQARRLNAPYLTRLAKRRPWVILKWAQSLDGKIATRTGDSKWISGEKSRRWVHELRGRVDAVIVGVGTVLADDPDLTCRLARPKRKAVRVVLDPHLKTPLRCRLIRSAKNHPTILVTDPKLAGSARAKKFISKGAEVLPAPMAGNGLSLRAVLREFARRAMTSVLVEGGGAANGAFLDAGLADEAFIFVARRLIGGRDAVPAIAGQGPATLRTAPLPAEATLTRCGDDDLYHLLFNRR
jgi:diaminohydroxyphosphoribosylaminopyrimidine deaminase/5-amino-6-(5-phosphoribosylamino)uracil reductase